MFTGIITAIGEIVKMESLPSGKRYEIKSPYENQTIEIGASISHDGVCLTVVAKTKNTYSIEAWQETLEISTASQWQVGTKLNLERALKIGDELGGHIVLGHVDDVVKIIDIKQQGDARCFVLSCRPEMAKFIASKGCIALNGVSLTVNNVKNSQFDVLLISHSLSATTWQTKQIGDNINLEIDMMARYVARLSQKE